MSERESQFSVWGFVKGIGKFFIGAMLVIQGVIGLFLILMLVGILSGIADGMAGNKDKVAANIEEGSALTLNLNGYLVEQAEEVDPFEEFIESAYGVDEPDQIEVGDVVRAIKAAKDG